MGPTVQGAMFYGAAVWDPWLILTQIITVQCLFYLSFGLLLYILLGPYVTHLSLQHFFDDSSMDFHTFSGWMVVVTNLLNATAAAIILMFVVERAKKCLDFAATLYLIHLAIVSIIGGFPTSVTWWLVNVGAMAITAVLGEWLCLRRELQDIPLSSITRRFSGSAEALAKTPSSVATLTGALFGRGSNTQGPGAGQLPSSRSTTLRPIPEDQV